jgi:thiamine-phosphate pyrophosphorylase
MTDERIGDALWPALRRLPPGGGVVFRHHSTPPAARRTLLRRVERIATARRLVLLVAGGGSGKAPGYGRVGGAGGAAAHDRREAIRATRAGTSILFVSPVFATRSHPGAAAIGPLAAARIGRGLDAAVIALGGMTPRRWRRTRRFGFDGWAAIDAWMI